VIQNDPNPELLEADTGGRGLSRRELLIGAGLVGIAGVSAGAESEPLKSFTTAEAATVSAIVARLIPTDENGPGAIEAHVDRYIDRLLSGPHNSYRGPNNPHSNLADAYAAGLKAVDAYAQATHGGLFASLSPDKQDAILNAMQANSATGFTNSHTFFNLMRQHAIEGMFGDPYYGGNANFAGWDLVDFPGIKLVFTEEEQKLDVTVQKAHKSTTDYAFFGDNRKGM
jgi:Gluconate 2-dehydrogenase subunit 3